MKCVYETIHLISLCDINYRVIVCKMCFYFGTRVNKKQVVEGVIYPVRTNECCLLPPIERENFYTGCPARET
jgi:hypothetical protein